jgi:outer membrane protein assembly factor BamB
MPIAQTDAPTPRKPLRLWPGVVAAALLCVVRFVVPVVVPGAFAVGILGGLVGALAIVVWWTFFSRAPWSERLGALALMIVAFVATSRVIHVSIATGAMGMLFVISAIPVLSVAFVTWAVASRRLSDGLRRASMVVTILLACGVWTLLRTDGITGGGGPQWAWRWTKTPEQRLLAQAGDEPVAVPPAPAAAETPKKRLVTSAGDEPAALPSAPPAAKTPKERPAARTGDEPVALVSTPAAAAQRADWPGFRGPDRNGIVRGVRIATDWSRSPPVQLWRRPIGPGWSSFAVRGDLLYTQEQRGDDEAVSCYRVTTGQPVWRHRYAVRFWESNGGAGPRATPTLGDGRVYTFGATGILNALDAGTGAVVWSRNVASDTGTKVPTWGFASSPLVVDGRVIVAAAGKLVAYDLATGDPRWSGPARGMSYSSPQRATIDGVAQVLLLNEAGATSVAPANGTLLWEHKWSGATIVQPALMADGDVLISTSGASGGLGIRRLRVAHGPGGWTVQERWTSDGLCPYFNDYVVHQGHAFGFDGSTLSCIDLEHGTRKWEGGRYGNGQLVLLPDQDLLLVVSEEGELALVRATPDRFTEVARSPALKGKTWNHPVVVGDVLLVRNGQEMAAFRLSPARR